jgi:phosphotransferase system enzyme I (PtsI)
VSRRDKNGRRERVWRGVGVSEGAAVGRVLRVHGGAAEKNVYRATLEEADVRREIRRFHAAVRLSRRQLLAIKRRAETLLGSEHAYIFDAHLLMLEDRKLIDDVESYIRDERANAEWAVKVVADRLLAVYAEIKDDYLRERSSDIEDVLRRLLVALAGEQRARRLNEDAVLVAEELLPSAVADLDFSRVRAVASDAGGWTSHAAIIARGLGIPAVVGLRDLYRHARTGDEIAVDAVSGEVVLRPSAQTVARAQETASRLKSASSASVSVAENAGGTLRTTDGVEIILRANVELPAEYDGVRRFGARGIGLYRSEFLFAQHSGAPTEDEQFAAYVTLARIAGADGARVRLFDLGGDKLASGAQDAERNPALGLRAIRLCLRQEDVMRTQVRAVLRAAAEGKLDLVLPMISDISEVRRVRQVVAEERARLEGEGKETGEVKIGAMIEVPSAVIVADRLAREVDFFSLGTNDLVQYTLAVDRSNGEVADWFRTLHPAVLASISRVVVAASDANITTVVCGEMAGTPAYAVILVGLGARDLSMTATAIPRVRRVLAGIDAGVAAEIARECAAAAGADEAEELVRVRFTERWSTIFPPKSLPAPKGEGYNFNKVGHTASTST